MASKQSLRSDKLSYHTSVLLKEATDLLQVKSGRKYIDATLGGGGHTETILKLGGRVLGVDFDKEAINHALLKVKSPKLKVVQGNFKDIDKIALLEGFEKVAGVIFDLGVSSSQIEKAERGFSFQKEGPLDMRMNQDEKSPTAADILNLAGKDELYKIFTEFGEEPRARVLASVAVRAREIKAFRTTGDLLKIIKDVYGIKGEISDKTKASISKRVFQALRVVVNSELENLKESLPKALRLLEERGRLVVITFHSLEDRIVKEIFLDFENRNLGKIITKKPIIPGEAEQNINRRSRSAKLRVFEKYV